MADAAMSLNEAPIPVAQALASVRARLEAGCAEINRRADTVSLVAVSKTVPVEGILPALEAGQRAFGENRVQELLAKWPPLRDRYADLELHLIGPLQTNKVREAVAHADFIHALDRPKLAEALAAERDRSQHCPKLFIQVNTGEEPQKAGIGPREADTFVEDCRKRLALPVVGLMCIPPVDDEPAPHFALLREIARRQGLPSLSMGMTADFKIAIGFGATHIRVGTAIFGTRRAPL
ncbi:MAG: YggS family pyridoxal phosphate-dependent enzyme [Alphaproteobacteria bacterium]|nr:YggS family pyridoxal phosphate-dependent enzyme [Alphaproteobacteria bacterium]